MIGRGSKSVPAGGGPGHSSGSGTDMQYVGSETMNTKSIPILVWALALVAALAAGGCTTSTPANPDPAHNARVSLDWAGAYRGILPCADCEGIETVVVLADDETFSTQRRYLGKGEEVFTTRGSFDWNAAGNTVILAGDPPTRYFVGENRIWHLALDGSRITGALAENYVLDKLGDSPTGTYWKLVELNGQPVPKLDREPYMILDAESGKVNGFGGCNRFGGPYTLDEATSRIRFGDLAATMMACPAGMDVERAFHEVLRRADNYSRKGDRLTLNRARMAPLARFEAVYLR